MFWDMHEITSRTETVANGDTNEKVVYITITAKTKEEMIEKYHFTRKQQEALDTLLEQDEVLISATQSLAVSDRAALHLDYRMLPVLPYHRRGKAEKIPRRRRYARC